ncbi:hypothetical protein [Streptomyces lincolnensis]|uniref:hypothetical protein n=1 Tax=Streptomyces lincolnensis TaxID=1915 RepID=UPI0037D2806F
MSSTIAPDQARAEEERTKRRPLRRSHRMLTVVGVLLSLVAGVAATEGTASAQPPTSCYTCHTQQPAGVTAQDWHDAQDAANFWSNRHINWSEATWRSTRSGFHWDSYYRLDNGGPGWPDPPTGYQGWFYLQYPNTNTQRFMYTGGTYRDDSHILRNAEMGRGVTPGNAQGGAQSGYREYDIDSHTGPGGRGVSRGQRRIVRNIHSGHVYATFDHYKTFHYLGHF